MGLGDRVHNQKSKINKDNMMMISGIYRSQEHLKTTSP